MLLISSAILLLLFVHSQQAQIKPSPDCDNIKLPKVNYQFVIPEDIVLSFRTYKTNKEEPIDHNPETYHDFREPDYDFIEEDGKTTSTSRPVIQATIAHQKSTNVSILPGPGRRFLSHVSDNSKSDDPQIDMVPVNPEDYDDVKDDQAAQQPPKNEVSDDSKPKRFHCSPSHEIYVPKLKKKMPSYICRLGEKAFVLTSEKFLPDQRPPMLVDLDLSTYERLAPKAKDSTRDPSVDIISAILIKRQNEKNSYVIKIV